MRGYASILAALGLSLALAGAAGAWGPNGHGHDRGGREGRPPPFAGGGFERGPEGRGPPEMGPPRGGPPGEFVPRRYNRPDYPGYPPGYGPGAPPPFPPGVMRGGGWRRGQVLPPSYWGGAAIDPHRFRLRTPPPGYAWYGIGRDAYLVQRSTGLILDTVPGLW